MNDRIAAVEAAFKAGHFEDGVALTEALLTDEPKSGAQLYRNFASLLFRRGRYEDSARWAKTGAEIYPRDSELWNVLGVSLRRLGRPQEALQALNAGIKAQPKSEALWQNKGNVLNDLKDGPGAIAVFSRLVRDRKSVV